MSGDNPAVEPAVEYEEIDGVVVLRLRNMPLLDEPAYKLIADAIEELSSGGKVSDGLVVSLDGVKLVSTLVWGKLFVLGRKLGNDGSALAICSLGQLLKDAIHVLKLEQLISVYENEEDAVKGLKA